MGMIIFNGIASTDYDIQVERFPEYEMPARDYETVHVPGRNGDVYIYQNSYKNVNRSYEIAIASLKPNSYTSLMSRVSEWLHSSVDYSRLEDSYEPEYYRMGVYEENISFDNVLNQGGRATINFNCKPQRFLKMGDHPIIFSVATMNQTEKIEYLEKMISLIKDAFPYKILFPSEEEMSIEDFVDEELSIEDRVMKLEKEISLFNERLPYKIFFEDEILHINDEERIIEPYSDLREQILSLENAVIEINKSLPYRILEEKTENDETVITFLDDSRIFPFESMISNPTKFESLPIITIKGEGYGKFTIGDCIVEIADIQGSITINSELQDCYTETANRNYDVYLPNGFPTLESGNNYISFTGGISSMEVIPKWWIL